MTFGSPVPTEAARSAPVVSHHLDGFLRSTGSRRIAAWYRSWGSPRFDPPRTRARAEARTLACKEASPQRVHPSTNSPRRQPHRITAAVALLLFPARSNPPERPGPKTEATGRRLAGETAGCSCRAAEATRPSQWTAHRPDEPIATPQPKSRCAPDTRSDERRPSWNPVSQSRFYSPEHRAEAPHTGWARGPPAHPSPSRSRPTRPTHIPRYPRAPGSIRSECTVPAPVPA
jgi:hypothetical protein